MKIDKLPRLEGKRLVKHQVPRRQAYSNRKVDTLLRMKSTTPFVSALKRIERMLANLEPMTNRKGHQATRPPNGVTHVTVEGMGRCISRLMDVCTQFEGKGHRVELFTRSVEVLDEYQDVQDEAAEDILRKRRVGCLVAHIYPNSV